MRQWLANVQPRLKFSLRRCAVSRLVCRPTRMPSLTICHFCAFTPSSSNPTVAMPVGEGAIGGDVELRRAVFQLAEVGDLDEARAGVVGLVAGDAIELGRVRDDLVNRQREVRRHQDEILQALADRLGLRVLDRFGGDALGLAGQVALDQELVAAAGQPLVVARLHLRAGARRRRRAAVAEVEDLLDERALARREVLPLVLEAGRRVGEEDARRLLDRAR